MLHRIAVQETPLHGEVNREVAPPAVPRITVANNVFRFHQRGGGGDVDADCPAGAVASPVCLRNRRPCSLFDRLLDLPHSRPVTRQAEGQTRVLFDAFGYGEFRCLRAVTLHCSGEGAAGGVGQG